MSQISNLYSTNKVKNAVLCELSAITVMRYNQDKENERCLLNLQIISLELNFLFQNPNLYSTKKERHRTVRIYLLRHNWDKETVDVSQIYILCHPYNR